MLDRNASFQRDDDLDAQLQAAVNSVLAEPIHPEAVQRVMRNAMNLQKAPAVPQASEPLRRARAMIYRSLSLAATIVLVVGGILWMQPSENAWGAVLAQLRAARSLSYVSLLYTDQQPEPIETKVFVAEDGRERHEIDGRTVTIMDANSRVRLTLSTDTKHAIRAQAPKTVVVAEFDHRKWLEDLKSESDNAVEQLENRWLEGRKVKGFVAKRDKFAYTVWIDATTKELVQIEYGSFVKGSPVRKVVMKSFHFNIPLEESLFSFDVPKGYSITEQPILPTVEGGEASIIEALRGFTKQSQGKFPKSIAEWGEWAILFSQNSTDGKLSEETYRVLAHLGSITPFLIGMSPDDYEYLGNGKRVDDPKCIIFWYRSTDKGLRAIYNDLSVSEIKESDLP